MKLHTNILRRENYITLLYSVDEYFSTGERHCHRCTQDEGGMEDGVLNGPEDVTSPPPMKKQGKRKTPEDENSPSVMLQAKRYTMMTGCN